MSKATEVLTGKNRAAILLMSLGEEAASEVLKYIDPQEVQQVGQAMAEIGNISREQVNSVVQSFTVDVQQHTALGIGSEQYLRTVLGNALGAEKSQGLIERILQGRNTKGLDALKWSRVRNVPNRRVRTYFFKLSGQGNFFCGPIKLPVSEHGENNYQRQCSGGRNDLQEEFVFPDRINHWIFSDWTHPDYSTLFGGRSRIPAECAYHWR